MLPPPHTHILKFVKSGRVLRVMAIKNRCRKTGLCDQSSGKVFVFITLVLRQVKAKLYPCNTPWRPIGLWDVEAAIFSRQMARRWRWTRQPYAPTARPLPPGRFLVLISVRGWVDLRVIVQLEGLGHLKNPVTSSGIEPASHATVNAKIITKEIPKVLVCISLLEMSLTCDNIVNTWRVLGGWKYKVIPVTDSLRWRQNRQLSLSYLCSLLRLKTFLTINTEAGGGECVSLACWTFGYRLGSLLDTPTATCGRILILTRHFKPQVRR
jgi:hypothetical protein